MLHLFLHALVGEDQNVVSVFHHVGLLAVVACFVWMLAKDVHHFLSSAEPADMFGSPELKKFGFGGHSPADCWPVHQVKVDGCQEALPV